MLHFVVGTIMQGYNMVELLYVSMVEHSVTGANYCTSANYYMALNIVRC